MMMPLGTYANAMRTGGFAARAWLNAIAGTIASRNGRATAAPIPRRNVRRGKATFVIIIPTSLTLPGSGFRPNLVNSTITTHVHRHSLGKRNAYHDLLNQRFEAVIIA